MKHQLIYMNQSVTFLFWAKNSIMTLEESTSKKITYFQQISYLFLGSEENHFCGSDKTHGCHYEHHFKNWWPSPGQSD